MEWWHVTCPMHGCKKSCYGTSQNVCWEWLQDHLASSHSTKVPHPRDNEHKFEKALEEAVFRQLTDEEIQEWHEWHERHKKPGKSSSSEAKAEREEDKEVKMPAAKRSYEDLDDNLKNIYKRLTKKAEVAESAAKKMKTVSEASLQLFAEQEVFFKDMKEEMAQELAMLKLPK